METIDDIVREMREHYCCTTAPRSCWVMRKADLIGALDRIEAALKRERAQHAAVLREQIDEVQRAAVYTETLKRELNIDADNDEPTASEREDDYRELCAELERDDGEH